ncbi:MAG: HEAT repeat domain-containing protein [Myxococcota bacterium]
MRAGRHDEAGSATLAGGLDMAAQLAECRRVTDAPRPEELEQLLRDESALLQSLSPGQRIAALILAGPGERLTADDDALWDQIARLDPAEVLPRELADGEVAHHLTWSVLISDDPDDALEAALAAAAFAMGAVYPMAVGDVADVRQIRHARAREVLTMGLASLSIAGHRTAEGVIRRLLCEADLEPSMTSAAIKGLGGGLADAGIGWLAERAGHALDDRVEWLLAGTRVLPWAFERKLPASRALLRHIVAGAADPREALALLPPLDEHPDSPAAHRDHDRRLVEQLAAERTRWPPAVRARLVTLAAQLGVLDSVEWQRDAAAEVLLAALDALPAGESVDAQDLHALLTHPERSVRAVATKRLMGPRGLKMVPHPSPPRQRGEVVSLPSSSLGRTPLDRLRGALAGDESEAVVALALAVGEDERLAARQTLVASLALADVAIRRAAVEALGHIGTPEDAAPLLEAARRFRGLEGLVAAALRQFEAHGAIRETAELFHRRLKWADDDAIDDFVALAGGDAAHEISLALQTRFYPPARAGAARAVARIELKEAIFALRNRALTDPNEDARSAAMKSLRALAGSQPTMAETSGYALMFTPVDDLDQTVERCRQAGAAALPGIRTTLSKGSWRRRVAACSILAHLAVEEAGRVLEDTLLDPDEDVRAAAWAALQERGFQPEGARQITLGAMAERALEPLTREPSLADLPTLEAGLTMGGHVFRTEVLAALEALASVRAWNPHPQIAAAVAGTRLQPRRALTEPDGLRVLLTMIDRTWQLHPHRATMSAALFSVPPSELAEALSSPGGHGWRAREAVCHALGRPGDGGAIEPLVTYLQDADADVRAAAVESLVRIGTRDAALGLARGAESPFQEDADAVAQGLAAIGRAAVPALVAMSASSWWEARRVAALALHDWRDDLQEAADLALPLALDPEYRVAEVARNALARHGLRPRAAAIRHALSVAQTLTVPGVEVWLGTDAHGRLRDPAAVAVLREQLDGSSPDDAIGRIGVIAALRVRALRQLVDRAAEGVGHDHIGLRLAAADALRQLDDRSCRLCAGRGAVRCAACEGDGDLECPSCDGEGAFERPCPEEDCNARDQTRAIGSRACKTCRGRGVVSEPCECADGRVPCRLCHSAGRTPCLLCAGTGETPQDPDLDPDPEPEAPPDPHADDQVDTPTH